MIHGDVGTDLKHILWYAATAAEFVLLLRLLFLRIVREYRFFFVYLLLSVLQSVAVFVASRSGPAFSTNAYAYTWACTEPLMIAALIAFTLECYGLVYHYYTGVDDPNKPIINRIVLVGGAICLASLFPDLWASHWQPALTLFFVVERTVTTLGAMLMALVVGAHMFMPTLMPPNIMRHARITLAYLTVNTIGYFGLNVWGSDKIWSSAIMGAGVICFLLWTVKLTRAGEIRPEPDRTGYDPAFEAYWDALVHGTPPPGSPDSSGGAVRRDG